MPSLTITTRQTATGPRYVVRYRLGGMTYPLVHAGSFRTLKEAKARRELVGGLIATGQNPADTLRTLADPAEATHVPRMGRYVPGEPCRPRRNNQDQRRLPPEADDDLRRC